MFPHECNNLPAHVVTIESVYIQTIEKTLGRRHARFLMPARAQSAIDKFSCSRLPKIMGQRGEHHCHLARVRKSVD
jgi:hypothetical protein